MRPLLASSGRGRALFRLVRRSAILAVLAATVCACGQTGPLTLEEPAQASAPAGQPASAGDRSEDDER